MSSNEKEFYKNVGKTIRNLRVSRNMVQIEMAKFLNLQQAAYHRVEAGQQRLSLYQFMLIEARFGTGLFLNVRVRLLKNG